MESKRYLGIMSDYEEHWNWTQVNKYLVELKDALAPVVKDNIKKLHSQIYEDVCKNLPAGSCCTECTTANITPCYRANGLCHYDNGQCTYHDRNDPSRAYRPCPKGICDKVYKELRKKQHRYGKSTMRNTDVSEWSEDSWELAKCFMPEGYTDSTSADDTDLCGLTAVFINCKYMQNVVKDDLAPQDNIFCKLRDVRNMMVHSPNNRITRKQCEEYWDVIMAVQRDNKLNKEPSVSSMPLLLRFWLSDELANTYKDESTWESSSTNATSLTYKRSNCEISDTDIKREAYNCLKSRLLQKQRGKVTPDSPYNIHVEVDNTLGCKKKAQKWAESREVEDRSGWTNDDKEIASYDYVFYVKPDSLKPRADIFQLIQSQLIKDNPRFQKEVIHAMMRLAGKVLVLIDSTSLEEWSPLGIPSIGTLDETEIVNRKLKCLGIVVK